MLRNHANLQNKMSASCLNKKQFLESKPAKCLVFENSFIQEKTKNNFYNQNRKTFKKYQRFKTEGSETLADHYVVPFVSISNTVDTQKMEVIKPNNIGSIYKNEEGRHQTTFKKQKVQKGQPYNKVKVNFKQKSQELAGNLRFRKSNKEYADYPKNPIQVEQKGSDSLRNSEKGQPLKNFQNSYFDNSKYTKNNKEFAPECKFDSKDDLFFVRKASEVRNMPRNRNSDANLKSYEIVNNQNFKLKARQKQEGSKFKAWRQSHLQTEGNQNDSFVFNPNCRLSHEPNAKQTQLTHAKRLKCGEGQKAKLLTHQTKLSNVAKDFKMGEQCAVTVDSKKQQVGSTLSNKKRRSTSNDQRIDWEKEIKMANKIGEGTFGKVYKACFGHSSKQFAVKRVPIDRKYKSREEQIVKMLEHPNIVRAHGIYKSGSGEKEFLNIVMRQYPSNFFETIPRLQKRTEETLLQEKVFLWQILKGLNYMHSLGVCHRDIKPHNMLVDGWRLALCDFGSAKVLVEGEANLSYICSRCYRAPELIFGSTNYSTQIDVWSVGCVILEMLNKHPLFIGESSLEHLLEVIKVLGTPSKAEVLAMNSDYDLSDYQLPCIKRKDLSKLFLTADSTLLDLANKILVYSPQNRLTAAGALQHPYFDELRNSSVGIKLKERLSTSDLFHFTEKELETLTSSQKRKLIPQWLNV